MKRLSYDGVVAVTADDVADAVLDLALVVARYGTYELVTMPVLVDRRREDLTLMLGPTIHVSALTDSAADGVELAGAADVAAQIRARVQVLTEPLHGVALAAGTLFAEN